MVLKSSDILADMHTHSLFSKHAYSTIYENMTVAKSKGLKYMAVTDHYFGNSDELEKKNEINRIKYIEERVNNPAYDDVKVIGSAEFNLNQKVYTFEKLRDLKWKPIGLHNWFVDTAHLTLLQVYNLFVKAYEDGFNAFVHIERELHKVNSGIDSDEERMELLSKLVNFAYDHDIWLEVNESSIITDECGGANRLYNWLRMAKDKGNKIYLGSDAHYCKEVGGFDNVLKLLNVVQYPKELILNCNEEDLKKLLK